MSEEHTNLEWSRFPSKDLGAKHHHCKVGVPLAMQPRLGHNRWHPDVPPVDELWPGEEIILEMPASDDYQLKDNDGVQDILNLDLTRVHPLAGPIYIHGAEPGDLLVVDILAIEPLSGVGYSCHIPGFGLLNDVFPDAFKSVWYCQGEVATSRHIPGVKIPAIKHPGNIGTAPSQELLELWHQREAPLYPEKMAYPPVPETAVLANLKAINPVKYDRAAATAVRTLPPRENGSNMDIKDMTPGSRVFFPVFVKGALFSVGDCHFAEGDGELTFNAIEMDGVVRVKVGLIKDGMAKSGFTSPVLIPGRSTPRFTNYLAFTGFNFTGKKQGYLNATWAMRDAALKMIDYIVRLGYTGYQAHSLVSLAPIQTHISEIVDLPNACVTMWLPLEIFDFAVPEAPVKY